MKKHEFLLVFLLLISAGISLAQDQDKVPQWEIGLDALSLVEKNNYPAFSVFASRKMGEKGYALRSLLGWESSLYSNTGSSPGTYPLLDEKNLHGIFLLGGLEKEILEALTSGGKDHVLVGLDLFYNWEKTATEELKPFVQDEEGHLLYSYYNRSITVKTIGVSPFIGYKRYFSKRLSIRLETALSFRKEASDITGEAWTISDFSIFEPFNPPTEGIPGKEYGGNTTYRFQLIPFNQFNISFNF